MKTIMARSPHEVSFSFSRRFLNWRIIKKVDEEDNDLEVLTATNIKDTANPYHSFSGTEELDNENFYHHNSSFSYSSSQPPSLSIPNKTKKKKTKPHTQSSSSSSSTSSKLRSAALSLFTNKPRSSSSSSPSLGSKVVGTLFGYRRGQVHIAFQNTPNSPPSFIIQISTPTSFLVREMASGLVRVALECDKKPRPAVKLLDEPLWRAYCNGRKCGYATRRVCDADDEEVARILKSVGPVTMGAGVLPGNEEDGIGVEGELMYMRARFERVVGSKDSEAFYMMNPDGNGGPELSVYLLRV